MIRNTKKTNSGATLLETLFYVCFFALLSMLVINAMLTMTKAFRETSIQKELMQGGGVMERMSREIRQASGIASISANSLKLNTTDDAGVARTVEFSLLNSNIRLLENDVFTGNLNIPSLVVVNITFTQITTAKGLAVKVYLTVRSSNDLQNRVQDFYDTVVLRGDY